MLSRKQNLTGATSGRAEGPGGCRRRRRPWLIGALPVALMFLALTASCSRDPSAPESVGRAGGSGGHVWSWERSSGGAPAVLYEVEVRPQGAVWRPACKTEKTEARIQSTDNHQVRVRGVDALGRPGPWSPPSGWSDLLVES